MKSQDHPEYPEESNRLEQTKAAIQRELRHLDSRKLEPPYDPNEVAIAEFLHNERERIKKTETSPYFGRIDFHEGGNKTEDKYYIGREGLYLGEWQIIHWATPVGGLYSKGISASQSYNTTDGRTIIGKLLLKRHYKIEFGKLLDIADEVDRRVGMAEGEKMVSSQDFILQALYTRGDPRLQDIIETIQIQQDEILRALPDRVLTIEGVAGSGKTSIAYHRLVFLTHPDNKMNIKADRIIIFGPNRLFLSYVGDLLPQLGVKGVNQTTFDDWAMNRMKLGEQREGKLKRHYDLQDTALNSFLDTSAPVEIRREHWKRARIKGGKKIKKLLELFVEFHKNDINIPPEGVVYSDLAPINLKLSISEAEIKEAHKKITIQDMPFEKLREQMVIEIVNSCRNKYNKAVEDEYSRRQQKANELRSKAEQSNDAELFKAANKLANTASMLKDNALNNPDVQEKVLNHVKARLTKDFNQSWQSIKLPTDYYKLLADTKLLRQLGENFLNDDDISLLSSFKPGRNSIDLEDIPALYYLYILCRGEKNENYDHIVIDEAQDFSSLQFDLIRRHSRDGSMTIVGDLAQGIFAHRGISDWSEIEPVFKGDTIQREEIINNYRSTKEIVLFNNEILRKVRRDKALYAEPYQRSGSKPRLIQVKDKTTMYSAVEKQIKSLQSQNIDQIGIIVKNSADCNEIKEHLHKHGIDATVISSRDTEYLGGIVILPVALSKGIEFMAVLVINANRSTYRGDIPYDGRLLYVASTRALHQLVLYSIGPFSSFLDSARSKADLDFFTESEQE